MKDLFAPVFSRDSPRREILRYAQNDFLSGLFDAAMQSETSRDRFPGSFRERGLVEENRWGECLERIVGDGDAVPAAALALNYPEAPHPVRVLRKVKNIPGDLNETYPAYRQLLDGGYRPARPHSTFARTS